MLRPPAFSFGTAAHDPSGTAPHSKGTLSVALRVMTMLASVAGATSFLGCGEQALQVGEMDPTVGVTGAIEVYVADKLDGTSETIHLLRVDAELDRAVRLQFDEPPQLQPGDRVRVWGNMADQQIAVARVNMLGSINDELIGREAALQAPPTSTTKKKLAFVLVDIGGGVNITSEKAASTVFSPGTAFAQQYRDYTYGRWEFTGDVLGPFKYQMSGCNFTGLASALKPMITTGPYDDYMWYLGSFAGACNWGGIAAVGSVKSIAQGAWYNATTSCTVLVQEVAHNFGWAHSSTLNCSGGSFTDNPSGCSWNEYGNPYTPMGTGCGHFTTFDKLYGQIWRGCNAVKVSGSTTINMVPMGPSCPSGVQAVQIAMPKTRTGPGNRSLKYYYLEFRVPGTPSETTKIKGPTLFVNVGSDPAAPTRSNGQNALLDMDKSTSTFDGMSVGQKFEDPAGGLSFTLKSMDTTHATIDIAYDSGSGMPTCLDGSNFAAPGPVACSGGTGTGSGGAGGNGGGGGATTGTGGRGGSTGGTGGRGGSGGGGRGGSAATGGSTTTGAGGAGGTVGPGTGGTGTGTGGSGIGVAGMTGTPGTAGTRGTGGTGVTQPGSGGSTGTTTGTGGKPGGGADTTGVVGGCACSTSPDSATQSFTFVGFALAIAINARRRRSLRRHRSGADLRG